jgi:hypothetical protein
MQMMHRGPFADELTSVAQMQVFIAQNGLADSTGKDRKHHAIYFSDPRKVPPPAKMKTVLRHPVARI